MLTLAVFYTSDPLDRYSRNSVSKVDFKKSLRDILIQNTCFEVFTLILTFCYTKRVLGTINIIIVLLTNKQTKTKQNQKQEEGRRVERRGALSKLFWCDFINYMGLENIT